MYLVTMRYYEKKNLMIRMVSYENFEFKLNETMNEKQRL